jgi:3-hydroxyacyl-CoA dehydrogenase
MAHRLDTAAVLGAGVMGTGIAAHLAGAGIKTYLLDIVPPNLTDAEKANPAARNGFAAGAVQKALKSKPATFFDPDIAHLITVGNFEDHLDKLAECDLVIEAVVENLDIKRSLFAKVAKVLKSDALLASNTSGLSLEGMTAELPADLQTRFCVMHFFNPVRYMHLLELVRGPKTSDETMARAAAIGDYLGKGVVYGKDTTNFIANRIGTYGLMKTVHLMPEHDVTIEEVDKIVGTPMGRPKSAAFQTGDIVGLDTFVHVANNCYDSLTDDPERDVFKMPEWILGLVKAKNLGRKTGAGFYKKVGKDIQVYDVATGEYREQKKVRFDSIGAVREVEDPGARLKKFVAQQDKAAKFGWAALAHTLCYSAKLVGEISDDLVQIDNAMKWGYNWDMGPFEAWDAIGVKESVARMQAEGIQVPKCVIDMLERGRESFYGGPLSDRDFYDVTAKKVAKLPVDPKAISLAALKEDAKNVVAKNLGAHLIDLGDGVLCLEVHTKMNTIDDDVIKMLAQSVAVAEKDFEALVIGNQGAHFGAGANLMLIYMGAMQQEWGMIDGAIQGLQRALQGLRYAKVPVVAAPFQYTFGGCAEIAMAADACQAQAETYMGLVEVGAGLLPGGGGCLRMVERWTEGVQDVEGADMLAHIGQGSLNIAMAKVATGAEEAKRLRFLLPTDGVSLHKGHHLYEAKQKALGMARAGYRPPRPRVIKAAGYDAAKSIEMRVWGMVQGDYATEHDAVIARKVLHVLTGGHAAPGTPLTEQHYLDLEREAFLSLCGMEKSQARMQSLLMSNKPLRN